MNKKAQGKRHQGTRRREGGHRAIEVGKRVFLRFPTAADRTEMIALKRASRQHLEEWESSPVGGGNMFGAWWFGRFLKNSNDERSKRFVVCLRESGEIIGQCGLGEIVRGAFQSCYMGYWIGAAHTRRGYMSEAVRLTLRHAFTKLKLHRVEANIVPRNKASKVGSPGTELEFAL